MSEPVRSRRLRDDVLNVPNLLTALRIVMIPVILYLVEIGTPVSSFWAAIVYALTAVTDFLDGWLARRQGLVSLLGKFLDPLADKLLVTALLVWLVHLGRVPAWAVVVILVRELSITSLRVLAMSEGVVIAAGRGGKEKTAFQMVALMMLLVHFPYDIHFGFATVHASFHTVGLWLLYASVVLTVTSGGEYVRLFVRAVEAKEDRLAAERTQPPASPDSLRGEGG